MWLAHEFENRKEPEGLKIMDFAFKEEYYVICSEQGEVYIRAVGTDNKAIPYYGKYGAMPYEFEEVAVSPVSHRSTTSLIGVPTKNVVSCMMSKMPVLSALHIIRSGEQFILLPSSTSKHTIGDLEVPSGVLRVNNMGAGTRCLAIGAYEKKDVASNGGLTFWSNYVSLIDVQGTGNYDLHEFAVKDMDNNSHDNRYGSIRIQRQLLIDSAKCH